MAVRPKLSEALVRIPAEVTRPRIAAAAMTVGIAAIPVGVGLVFGLGWAFVAVGALLIGVALLLGWS